MARTGKRYNAASEKIGANASYAAADAVKLVKEKEIGTAYGLMYSVQNLGLWGVPILAGMVLDRTNAPGAEVLNYTPTILMFGGLSLLGLLFGILLKWEDSRRNFGVELPLNKK